MLGRAFQTCNLKNKNCSELLLANGMVLDRAPIKFQKLFFLKPPTLIVGVERNRKQEFGSFQELLDLVPATFSPTCSAGPLFVLTSCFIYNVTLSGRTAFILGYLVLTEICKQKTETITSVNQNYHQVSGFEFGKVKLANKKVKLNNKFLNSILDS